MVQWWTSAEFGGVLGVLECREASQRDADKLEGWTSPSPSSWSLTRASAGFKLLEWGNFRSAYRLEDKRLESSPVERDLGVLGDGKLKHESACLLWQTEGPTIAWDVSGPALLAS